MVFTDQEGNDAWKNKAFTIAREGFNFLNNFRKNREDKTWCYKTCICLGHPLQLKPHSEDPLFRDFRGHQSNKLQTL